MSNSFKEINFFHKAGDTGHFSISAVDRGVASKLKIESGEGGGARLIKILDKLKKNYVHWLKVTSENLGREADHSLYRDASINVVSVMPHPWLELEIMIVQSMAMAKMLHKLKWVVYQA